MGILREHRRKQGERQVILGEKWQKYDLVFPSKTGSPINPDNLDRDFDRWVTKAKVPRIRIHDLRHTNATVAIDEGTNVKALSERLGHANIGITLGTYVHTLPEQHVEASRKIGAAFFGTGSPQVAGEPS